MLTTSRAPRVQPTSFVRPGLASCVALLGLSLQPACAVAGEDDDGLAQEAAWLTNATPTSDYPAVTELIINGDHWCTATLISPHLLLTAAHCIYITEGRMGAWLDGIWYQADGWRWNAGYQPNDVGVDLAYNYDIGVVHLKDPVTGVRPMPIGVTLPRPGYLFTTIGYGEAWSGQGDYRTKRRSTATVGLSWPTWFYGSSSASPCHGDSGGPAISNGVVFGVFARMKADCSGGSNSFAYVAVAAFRDWIHAQQF